MIDTAGLYAMQVDEYEAQHGEGEDEPVVVQWQAVSRRGRLLWYVAEIEGKYYRVALGAGSYRYLWEAWEFNGPRVNTRGYTDLGGARNACVAAAGLDVDEIEQVVTFKDLP